MTPPGRAKDTRLTFSPAPVGPAQLPKGEGKRGAAASSQRLLPPWQAQGARSRLCRRLVRAAQRVRLRAVVWHEDGQPLTDGLMRRPLERCLPQATITHAQGSLGWHDLRHTYDSHLAMRGVPRKLNQELMRHATIELTMGYAHLSPETKERAVQQLDAPTSQNHAALAWPRQRSAAGATESRR
ncbi:tyrosine-type recombinase/integrase [Corallococcus exiguus]|uniref:tyrosine-type recombinase/integrase n=1 Tax=Corallococcus exiguus TaxID=83462 RepID=UPI003211B73A